MQKNEKKESELEKKAASLRIAYLDVAPKDIPANVFAAGNPCRVIRKLKKQ